MARFLSFLIRYFSNYYTLHRSDLAARAAPLDPRLLVISLVYPLPFHCFWSLLEDRVLHKEAWVAKFFGTHLSIQIHKKVKFSGRDKSSLVVKGLIKNMKSQSFHTF